MYSLESVFFLEFRYQKTNNSDYYNIWRYGQYEKLVHAGTFILYLFVCGKLCSHSGKTMFILGENYVYNLSILRIHYRKQIYDSTKTI